MRQGQLDVPLVSCVMPTFDRRRFVPAAIDTFVEQDHPNRELVIVDDGTDPISDLVPDDPRVRYVRVDRRLSTGAKRNTACELARGEIIVHWDDDDWSAPDRVSVQVAALLGSGADVCGLRELLFYEPATDRAWRYAYPARGRPWVAGGTMCYRRALWQAQPFPEVRQGEDTQFVWSRRTLRVHAIARPDLYVAMIHAGNTSAKRTSGRRWSSVPASTVRTLLGPAAERYRPLASTQRSGQPPASARPRPPGARPVPGPGRDGAAPTRDGMDHVTVSIPHVGPGQHLRIAVDSILAQTHRDLTCVVVFDGDGSGLDALDGVDDPRLVRHLLPANRGRYFADHVVLGATASRYFLVQDSDDWSEPTRLERLLAELAATGADVCVSDAVLHDDRAGRARVTRQGWPRLHDPIGPELVHRAGHQALYRTDTLRALGGWYGGYRIGFDTAVLNFVLLARGRIVAVPQPLYHRRVRAGSLSSSAETGWGTPARRRVVQQLRDLQRRAYEASRQAGTREEAAAAIAELVRAGRTTHDEADLAREARRLATILPPPSTAGDGSRSSLAGKAPGGAAVATGPAGVGPPSSRSVGRVPGGAADDTGPAGVGPPSSRSVGRVPGGAAADTGSGVVATAAGRGLGRVPDVYEILARGEAANPGWAISPLGAVELYERLLRRGPRRVLDVGSGLSTIVAAAAVARTGGRVTALEHDGRHAERTSRLLTALGLDDVAEVLTSPLVIRDHRSGSGPWYGGQPQGTFDFAVVDGPPLGTGGRGAAFAAIAPHLAPDWELWLFDADRPEEQANVEQWSRCFRFDTAWERIDDTGVAVLRPCGRPAGSSVPVVQGLGISILGGGRPELLERTLASFERRWPGQVESAHVCVLLNGPDEASRALVDRRPWVDRVVTYEPAVLSIGMATSYVVGTVTGHGGVRTVLHLEDDWETCTLDDSALARAEELLGDPTIGQVRLRHRSEPALTRHMVSRRPIRWSEADGHRRADAHYTFNPSLIRAAVADRVFPAQDEPDAQRRFLTTGLQVAQITPGVFRHIGGSNSRRAALGRAR